MESPDTVKLAAYRSFLAAAKRCFGAVHIAEETSQVCVIWDSAPVCLTSKQYIREDFVRQRQADKSMTAEDLVHLMKVARCGIFCPLGDHADL